MDTPCVCYLVYPMEGGVQVATSDALLKDVRLTVCVDPHFAQSIYDLADDSDRTVSWMMRKLIEVGLENYDAS